MAQSIEPSLLPIAVRRRFFKVPATDESEYACSQDEQDMFNAFAKSYGDKARLMDYVAAKHLKEAIGVRRASIIQASR